MGSLNPGNLVVKSNPLINGKYNLDLLEQKVLLSIISLIEEGDSDLKTYKIKARDLAKMIGIAPNNMYVAFKKIANTLITKPIEIEDEGSWLLLSFVASCEYKKKDGSIEIELSKKLKPYLIDLKKNFTRYYLEYILKMNKKYSIRLYEITKSFQFKRAFNINLNELKEIIHCQSYSKWYDFKRNILEPSIKEINEKTDILIFYDVVKNGRSVESLNFTIQDKASFEQELYGSKE